MSLTIHEIEAARIRIAPYIIRAPLLRMKNLDQYLGCEVYAKAECMQTAGSFKLRGAMKDAALIQESVASDALVMPMSSWVQVAGMRPCSPAAVRSAMSLLAALIAALLY